LLSFISHGQAKKINTGGIEMQVSAVDTLLNELFCSVGQMPTFPGGMDRLVAFAKRKIKYPKTAVNENIEGSVILQFMIDKRGRVVNKRIAKGVRYDLDSVCLRMLDKMPKWKPGKLHDEPIDVNERWKITFVLTH